MSSNKWTPEDLPIENKPSASRIYDYLLGGYHNFEVDRMAARKITEVMPEMPLYMRANRAFLRRVVRYLVKQGVEQFLDIGSGIPTVGNVHEIAQEANPSARVVYVDREPVAVHQSKALLQGNPNATIIQADLRQVEDILDHPEARRLLDPSKPTAVLILSVLLFITDDEEAYRLVHVVRDTLAPGSYLAISHPTEDNLPREQADQTVKLYAAMRAPVNIRPYAQIERFFDGFELVEPGLVYAPLWRPESTDDLFYEQPELSAYYGGVGRKP
ncbi:MAG: hypothetical protein AVDCRST_MAG14-2578 [uncultured Rubrobacteraceae bacterium]|uniref:S-adenosyl methyltransferase n=1 Tax=uncultured Rubrobacteraceae bacterium TaxID=349277 RepID=A0A6J4RCD5_9ACTN|nr:MAG: hypothetical protein AVDCRST_MAG14-2578 [uncultured Rubrobacteraceae bacterium]